MEAFLFCIHYIQQILSYYFHTKLVSLKILKFDWILGKSEFGQKRMPKYNILGILKYIKVY